MSRAQYHKQIKERATELRRLINGYTRELEDLDVALRVLDRLSKQRESLGASPQDTEDEGPKPTKGGTVSDMAISILSESGPLNTGDLLEKLKEVWRPDLALTTLTSTLSRTKNEGRIVYENRLWKVAEQQKSAPLHLTKTVEAAGENLEGNPPTASTYSTEGR